CDTCHDTGKYKAESYIHYHKYLHHTTNPLWGAFLSLRNESTYCEDMLIRCLLEHFPQQTENLHIVKRPIKLGNNRPSAVLNNIHWMERAKFFSDILLYIDTHADSTTGNVVIRGLQNNHRCATIRQMIFSYFGEEFIKALAQTKAIIREGYTIVRGITLMTCGPAVRFHDSFAWLRALVDESLFDFVLAFGGSGTIGFLVTPTLLCFVENIYIYCLDPGTSLLCSFGKDQTTLDSTSIALIWAEYEVNGGVWVHKQGKVHSGNEWTKTKSRYTCSSCGHKMRDMKCPEWINAVGSGLNKRAEFPWPLSCQSWVSEMPSPCTSIMLIRSSLHRLSMHFQSEHHY
ncbi:hypothetical protein L210DRAFT_3394051, partial [Boletus edulis BED1]